MDQGRELKQAVDAAEGGTPADWARRLRRGDPSAAQEVRARVSRILQYRSLSIPEADREDLEQEIVTEVWQAVNRTGFDVSAGFWGFVEVVSSRRCIDWLRARRQGSPLSEELRFAGAGPLSGVLEKERARLASVVLAELDPSCRDLITLRLRDGLSYAEVARVSNRSEGALRVQLYRCIRAARTILTRATHAAEPGDAGAEDGRR